MQKFYLSDSFLEKYKEASPNWGAMGEFVYLRTYSRLVENENRNEKWWETVRRVVEGCFNVQKDHCTKLRLPWKNAKAQRSAQIMYDKIFNFKFLPPGRGLWMMGTEFIETRGGAALNNCFDGETEFLTNNGLVKFVDSVGEKVKVLNINGDFEEADVKSFGEQDIFEFTFRPNGYRTNYEIKINATENHRWILENGSETTSLKVGDKILLGKNKTTIEKKSTRYKTGFAHGLIFGDGTRNTYYQDRHFIKICDGNAEKYNKILCEVDGYKGITNPKDGRPVITIIRENENWKSLPETKDSLYIAGFIDGWISADAWTKPSGSICLDTISTEAVKWIIKNAFYAGYIITGISTDDNKTNYGERSFPLNRISMTKNEVIFSCKSKNYLKKDEVFCVVAPKTKTFTLAEGVLTGNCAFVSTEDIDIKGSFPFCFTMDALMLGVGVGFDTKGAGKITIKQPKNGEGSLDYTIPDSREGWVEGLELLLDSFFYGRKTPKFDFNMIRPYGSPIKGFGGTASGPGPLKEMYENISKLLEVKVGEELSSTDIVDIMNMIGVCVVAGNVRRSAEIAIGDYNDKSFVTMKDYKLYPNELKSHRWASNNSVFAEVGKTDYSKFSESIALNGEPGIVWLNNARKYGRLNDAPTWIDKHAGGVNPCITGDAVIETTEGRFTIKEMAESGRNFDVYSMNEKGELEIKPAFDIVKTMDTNELIYIELSNGQKLKCTPEHKIKVIVNGELQYIRAELLVGNFRLFSPVVLQRIKKGERYLRVKLNTQTKYTSEHRFVAGAYEDINGKDVHHINENTFDNRIDNLEVLEHGEHSILSNAGHEDWNDRDYEGQFIEKPIKIKKESIEAPEELLTKNGYGGFVKFVKAYKVVEGLPEPVYDMSVIGNHNFIANGMVVHNCGEQTLESYELCCLVETFPSLHNNYEEYKETLKYAYLYAKSVTLIATHWEETNAVMMKNRRIGTSQSGIIDAFVKHGRRETLKWSDDGYKYLKELDEIYSNWLCVPRSVKITSVKPSGSTSKLPGVSPGIHYPPAEYYIRRIRVAAHSAILEAMRKAGYNIVDEVYGSEETRENTKVVEFPIHEENFSRRKKDVTIWEQVKNAVDYQRYWADNNVSITVAFKQGESEDIRKVLEAYEDELKAISFLPLLEHGYDLAPEEEINKETYEKMVKKIKKPDFSHITSTPDGERYCDGDACELPINK